MTVIKVTDLNGHEWTFPHTAILEICHPRAMTLDKMPETTAFILRYKAGNYERMLPLDTKAGDMVREIWRGATP